MKAEFNRKETRIYAKEYIVEKVIKLPQERYDFFSNHLLDNYNFIEENIAHMYSEDGVMHCILVTEEQGKDGILVESERSAYARYSSFVPDVSAFVERQYTSLDKLNQELRDVVEYIVQDGINGTSNGSYCTFLEEIAEKFHFPDYYPFYEVIEEMLCEREEVSEVYKTEEGFDMTYYLDYCPNAEIESENQDNQTML